MYVIKKGKHYSQHPIRLHWYRKSMVATFKLMGDCSYDLKEPDDYAINKLCGWSMGISHHTNSIRCGWRPSGTPGIISLFFYLYSNGKRMEHLFTNIAIMKEYILEMKLIDNRVNFSLKGNGQTADKSISYNAPYLKFGYALFPYVGGKLPARWDTHIELDF